ncbi:NAD(P)H nitroreductase [Mycobacterium sp. 1245111.1]|uniref:Acg family FMN-binding oxidoreductase n=1 Tax=Mycobacterium sp. 1245111.1 TaxID=1834073 RepID=UPI0007FF8518|nr:NAD(P)H nitroreductase [Mycobacterium sp. 1245111.1]OBK35968.1 NAD(P)H nitroreductase [Mycobacterium sp. 1245111.1]
MPATIVETGVIEDAVTAACRAPSLHNSQPWRWVLNGGELRLLLDRGRVLSTDRAAREAVISCGAALDHLRTAMLARGWQPHIDRFPNPKNPDHLASITFTAARSVADQVRRRADAISVRRTDRLPYSEAADWDRVEPALVAAIDEPAVHLDVLPEDARPRLAYATELAENLRRYDAPYHDELRWWTAPYEASEGIPYSALVSKHEGERVGIDRTFPAGHQPERRSAVPEDHATVLLLSTDDDSRAGALAAGEALSAILLECTVHDLATCPVTHLTELHVTRDLVRTLVERDAVPQVLIRVGVSPLTETKPTPTPRRALPDVLGTNS